MEKKSKIDHYALYGEPVRQAELRFMHVERIRVRSGLHGWTIAPHRHADLHQILLVMRGGGLMRVEAEVFTIAAPALLIVPATLVHAFDFTPDIDGSVATVAKSFVEEATENEPLIIAMLQAATCVNHLEAEAVTALSDAFASLSHEFIWSAPLRTLALSADLTKILVTASRLAMGQRQRSQMDRDNDAVCLDRFRQLIEQDFRSGAKVKTYAAKLGLSEDRLLAVCRRKLGEPPKALIHRRVMVEAQRWLLYTTKSINEIGFDLGFNDPAYFSRFFTQRAGQSPKAFRLTQK
jgi:AraC family transcriptional regulator, transcriptional activator of pobA